MLGDQCLIPGFELHVYKEKRELTVEPDGYIGDLASGFVVLEVRVTDPNDPAIAFIRQGNDRYVRQQNWAALPDKPPAKKRQGAGGSLVEDTRETCAQYVRKWYDERQVSRNAKHFGRKIGLEVDVDSGIPFVAYPNNNLGLARQVYDADGRPTNRFVVWYAAVVSQGGKFFLTQQIAYDEKCYLDGGQSEIVFPRFKRPHPMLNDLLVASLPGGFVPPPVADYVPTGRVITGGVNGKEGISLGFDFARNIGTVLTEKGNARVHWSDLAARKDNRRRFLLPGERVNFSKIGKPVLGRRDRDFGQVRESNFESQIFGVSLCG